jgi:hypothetical protein
MKKWMMTVVHKHSHFTSRHGHETVKFPNLKSDGQHAKTNGSITFTDIHMDDRIWMYLVQSHISTNLCTELHEILHSVIHPRQQSRKWIHSTRFQNSIVHKFLQENNQNIHNPNHIISCWPSYSLKVTYIEFFDTRMMNY